MDKLSQMYPDLKFDFEFADEDIGRNAGDMLIQNGEILKGGFLDDCKEACETYFRLWGGETDYRFNENTGTYEYIDEGGNVNEHEKFYLCGTRRRKL